VKKTWACQNLCILSVLQRAGFDSFWFNFFFAKFSVLRSVYFFILTKIHGVSEAIKYTKSTGF